MTIRKSFISLLLLMFSLIVVPAQAEPTPEIQYLLSFIDQSNCIFIRNGTEHNAHDARKHIEKKYNYLESRIDTTESFISQAASKSSFSGKVYKVKCGDQFLSSEQWLLTALNEYRATR